MPSVPLYCIGYEMSRGVFEAPREVVGLSLWHSEAKQHNRWNLNCKAFVQNHNDETNVPPYISVLGEAVRVS